MYLEMSDQQLGWLFCSNSVIQVPRTLES